MTQHIPSSGRRIAHCDTAEHNETGMMFNFDVPPSTTRPEVTR
jgi:FtsP/CotA-like multicopper oxidase with cupredoxin domain